jgi:hypothetical protein
VAALCLLAAGACGPYSDDSQSTAGSNAPVGGAGAPPDGGTDGGQQPQQLLVVHDLHADSLTAAVVYAHDVKAKELRYDNLVTICDCDLPPPGNQDMRDGRDVTANEVHAHHVDVKLLQAGTLYVVSKPK